MNSGLVLCLALLTWSLVLPRTTGAAQPAGASLTRAVHDEDAMSTLRPDHTASELSGPRHTASGLNGTPTGPDDPTGAPPSLPGPSLPIDPTGAKSPLAPTGSKLSPRLGLLANLASTGSLPADVAGQDQLLGLAASGPGSLSRDDAGNPVVDVRVLDTSEQTLATIAALPADVLSVAPEYATITLAISPDRLNDLANLAAVQYVGEVIRPGLNSPGTTITGIP
jgi:hypothetical protein